MPPLPQALNSSLRWRPHSVRVPLTRSSRRTRGTFNRELRLQRGRGHYRLPGGSFDSEVRMSVARVLANFGIGPLALIGTDHPLGVRHSSASDLLPRTVACRASRIDCSLSRLGGLAPPGLLLSTSAGSLERAPPSIGDAPLMPKYRRYHRPIDSPPHFWFDRVYVFAYCIRARDTDAITFNPIFATWSDSERNPP